MKLLGLVGSSVPRAQGDPPESPEEIAANLSPNSSSVHPNPLVGLDLEKFLQKSLVYS